MAVTASQIIAKALTYVGYLEKKSNSQLDSFTANAGSNNWTMFGRDYDAYMGTNLNGQAWCAMFVSAIAIYLGMSDSDFYKFSYCPYGMTWYKNQGRFYSSPKVGDVIFFTNGSRAAHTGLVYKVTSSYVYTVEGNTSSASGVVANGGAVAQKSYSLSYSKILGYGRPYYGDETTVTTTDSNGCPYGTSTATVKYGSKGTHVYRCQWYLNEANNAGLDLDGDCGSKSEAAIEAFQKAKKLEVDGKCGPITWAELEQTVAELKNPIVIEEVEEVFTQQEFNTMMETYLLELEGKEVNDYAKSYFAEAKANGITDGTKPQMYLTRQDAITMFGRMGLLSLKEGDVPSEWAKEIWDELTEKGIFDGTRPQAAISREQVAAVLRRYADKLSAESE